MTFEIVMLLFVGIQIGWLLHKGYNTYRNEKIFKSIMADIEKEEQMQPIIDKVFKHCYTEHSDNQVFLYDVDTSKFLGQADTLENLSLNLKQQGVQVAFVHDGDTNIWLNNGKIMPVTEE